MKRRGFLVVAAVCLSFASASGATAAPTGPRLAISVWGGWGFDGNSLLTLGSAGDSRATVFSASSKRFPQPYPLTAPAWSSDGTQLAFTAITGPRTDLYSRFLRTAIALVGADGGDVTILAGTGTGAAPVFSPDGAHIAYAKVRARRRPNGKGAGRMYSSDSIWIRDLASGESRQLTPWRNRLYQVPSSFSPDGSRLAYSRFVGHRPPEALTVELTGSAGTLIARNAMEPVYSPDGSRIAFLRGPLRSKGRPGPVTEARMTDLFTIGVDGGDLLRLTKTKSTAELAPSWDPSGKRLAFTAQKPLSSEDAFFGFGDQIREINADGSCSTTILSERTAAFYGSAWQPGAGREAGPISC